MLVLSSRSKKIECVRVGDGLLYVNLEVFYAEKQWGLSGSEQDEFKGTDHKKGDVTTTASDFWIE